MSFPQLISFNKASTFSARVFSPGFSLALDIGNVAIWHFDSETHDCPSDIGANLVTPSLWFNQILRIFWIQDFQKTWELGTAGFVIFQDCSYTQVDDELAADLIGAWRENLWKNRNVVMILLRNKAHHWKSHEIKKNILMITRKNAHDIGESDMISLSWKDSAIKGDLKCLSVGLASWLNISILKLLIVGSFPPCFALYQPYLCSNVSFAIRMFQLENAVGSLVVWLSFFPILILQSILYWWKNSCTSWYGVYMYSISYSYQKHFDIPLHIYIYIIIYHY